MITTRESKDELEITLTLVRTQGVFTLTYTNKMDIQTIRYTSNASKDYTPYFDDQQVQQFETALKQGNIDEIRKILCSQNSDQSRIGKAPQLIEDFLTEFKQEFSQNSKSVAQALVAPVAAPLAASPVITTKETVRARLLEAEAKNDTEHAAQTAQELQLAKERMAALKKGKQEHELQQAFRKQLLSMTKIQAYQMLKSNGMFSPKKQKTVYALSVDNNNSREKFVDFLISSKLYKR